MKRFGNLLINETVKNTRSVGFYIVVGIFVICCMVAPIFLQSVFTSLFGFMDNLRPNQNTSQMEELQSEIKDLKKIDTQKSKIQVSLKNVEYEYYKNVNALDLLDSEPVWKYNVLSSVLDNNYNLIYIDCLVNKVQDDIIKEVFTDEYTVDTSLYLDFNEPQLKNVSFRLKAENTNFQNILSTNDYKSYLKSELDNTKEQKSNFQLQLDQINKKLKETPTNKDLKTQSQYFTSTIISMDEQVKVLQYKYDKNLSADPEDWRNKTLDAMDMYIMTINTEIPAEEEFNKNADSYKTGLFGNLTYQEFVKQTEQSINDAKNQVKLHWYSLDENIPLVVYNISTRAGILNTTMVIGFISLIMLFFAGIIVSSEYNSGTIRLLLIRPIRRYKILASKYTFVLLLGFILLLASMVIGTLSSIIFYGISDLKNPILSITQSGIIKHTNFFAWAFLMYLAAFVECIFYSSLALMFSTIIKNIALPIVFTYVGTMIVSMATGILALFNPNSIYYNPFTYLNLSEYFLPNLNGMLSGMQGGAGVGASLSSVVNQLHIPLGLTMVFALIVIFQVIAYRVFTKRNITF